MSARAVPWVAAGIAAAAGAAALAPAGALEYGCGDPWWRLLASQFVHWTPRMAALDLGAAIAIAATLERRSRRTTLAAALAGFAATAACVALLLPAGSTYRGASGIATALFAALAGELALRGPGRTRRLLAVAASSVFAAKCFSEFATGLAVAAGPMPGVRVAAEVHLAAWFAGTLAVLLLREPRRAHRVGMLRSQVAGADLGAAPVERA